MKCIQCGTDNTLRDRTDHQGRCKNCNHRFAFEPTAMTGIRFTDPFFAKVLNDLSANNTLYFTSKQLFYFLEKRLHKKAIVAGGVTTAVFGWIFIIVGFFLISTGIGWIAIAVGVVLLLIGWLRSKLPLKRPRALVIDQGTVEEWLRRWNQVNSPPQKLIPPQHNQSTSSVQPAPSADITAYSFDRLVVCDSVAIAQMLIANNFHFENNCAVLSISGYPEQIFETAMQMLRRNPDLRVFALHNCSPSGMEVVHQLRTDPAWFAESNVVIVDVGLLPRQIMVAKKNMSIQNSERSAQAAQNLAPQIRQTLSKEELQWLDAGNLVNLESFTPQALIQILQRSMASRLGINEADSSLLLVGEGGYGGSSIYAVDSFG